MEGVDTPVPLPLRLPAALDLFELRAMARGRDDGTAREWRNLAERVTAAGAGAAPAAVAEPAAAAPVAGRPRRRRRGGRRRRGQPV